MDSEWSMGLFKMLTDLEKGNRRGTTESMGNVIGDGRAL
jgi:hypothetical protein